MPTYFCSALRHLPAQPHVVVEAPRYHAPRAEPVQAMPAPPVTSCSCADAPAVTGGVFLLPCLVCGGARATDVPVPAALR
jgi:hypothetical protein